MPEPIADVAYWRRRLKHAQAAGDLHWAVFRCPLAHWRAIEDAHRAVLARTVGPLEGVLDAGCGWGRLLGLMPAAWHGDYLGVDLSPDFIALARQSYPDRDFLVADLRKLPLESGGFDWAILISVRPMVKRNLGEEAWAQMEAELRRVAGRLLFLEYDPLDPGSAE